MSTTEYIIITSRVPTYGCTCPLASVLTISFGTPNGSARIAAVPMVVPAEPPRPSTPRDLPLPVQFGRELRHALGRQRHRLPAIARAP